MELKHIEERFKWLEHWIGNLVHSKINNALGGNMTQLSFDEFLHCKSLDDLVDDDNGFIPAMTDPMGRYWNQPHHSGITFRNGIAEMNKYSFDLLYEYNNTYPSGVYIGKMWKRAGLKGEWFLCWYDKECEQGMSIEFLKIKIVNPNYLYMYDKQRTLIVEGQVDDFEYYVKLQKKQQDNLIKAHYSNS